MRVGILTSPPAKPKCVGIFCGGCCLCTGYMFKAPTVEVAVKSQKVIDVCQGGNFRTCWRTPEEKEAVKLRKEVFRAWLAAGSAEVADR